MLAYDNRKFIELSEGVNKAPVDEVNSGTDLPDTVCLPVPDMTTAWMHGVNNT